MKTNSIEDMLNENVVNAMRDALLWAAEYGTSFLCTFDLISEEAKWNIIGTESVIFHSNILYKEDFLDFFKKEGLYLNVVDTDAKSNLIYFVSFCK